MSEYQCFNCNITTHTSDLVRVEWKGLVSLLCHPCMDRLFVEEDNTKKEAEEKC